MACCGYYPQFDCKIEAVAPVTSFECCPSDDWKNKPLIHYGSSSNYQYLPSPLTGPRGKMIYVHGEPLIPGYSGHVPAFKYHGCGRTYGAATRDTGILAWSRLMPCFEIPERVWEQ